MAREKRSFKPDPQLLVDIIKRQAGSLWKAVVEGIMNAVDAGASRCDIRLTREQLIIQDNGKGFRSRNEITTFFERFGMKHEARENKTFGTFRMGRGQLFAFGFNTWRSGKFEMTIDIDHKGLDYHLEDGLDHQDGCRITVELYQQLSHTDYARMLDEIKDNAKYVGIAVTLNGNKFTADTSQISWDLELPEADIVLRQNQDLRVYNQGVKVLAYYRHHYGVGGDVVTKVPIKTNFARNDIMVDCPVWAKIVAALRKHVNTQQTRTRNVGEDGPPQTTSRRRAAAVRLTEADRVRLCNQAKDGNLEAGQFKSARLFRKYGSSANFTVRQIANVAKGVITVPPDAGAPYSAHSWDIRSIVDQINMNALACVVHCSTLERFGLDSGPALVALVNGVISSYDRHVLKYVEWADLVTAVKSDCQVVPDAQLNRIESVVLGVIRAHLKHIVYRPPSFASGPKRRMIRNLRIVLGRGPLRSWTDGASYVAINRAFVRKIKAGPGAWAQYAHLIMHEALHDKPTITPHKHSKAFYEHYHNWMALRWAVGGFAWACTVATPAVAARVRQRLTETELREIYRVEAGRAALAGQDLIADEDRVEPEDVAT